MELTELLEIAKKERQSQKPQRIRCCVAAGCLSANSLEVKQRLEAAVTEAGLPDAVQVSGVGCMRLCCQGPLVQVNCQAEPESLGTIYEKVTPADAASIIAALKVGEATAQCGNPAHPFFTQQMSVVLENSGKVDPDSSPL